MVGFAGPLLSFHPGLQTIGKLAVIGIGTTLIATLTFLPALMQLEEKRHASQPV
jgi:predicted RND superfamily exporter protein